MLARRQTLARFQVKNAGAFLFRVLCAGKFSMSSFWYEYHRPADEDLIDFDYRLLKAGIFRDVVSCLLFAALLNKRRGGFVLDVGANLGQFGRRISKITGCKVIYLEPNPALWEKLERNTIASESEYIRAAASDVTHRVQFHYSRRHTGAGHIADADKEAALPPMMVDAVKIDDLLQRYTSGGSQMAGMKVDVEGHEEAVFRGAELSISRYRPLLCFETSGDESSWQDIVRFLPNYSFLAASVPGMNFDRNYLRRFISLIGLFLSGRGLIEEIDRPTGYMDGVIAIPNEWKREAMAAVLDFAKTPVNLLS
jgi:FkbM family methyltransferase